MEVTGFPGRLATCALSSPQGSERHMSDSNHFLLPLETAALKLALLLKVIQKSLLNAMTMYSKLGLYHCLTFPCPHFWRALSNVEVRRAPRTFFSLGQALLFKMVR